jgi:hypothetical protein
VGTLQVEPRASLGSLPSQQEHEGLRGPTTPLQQMAVTCYATLVVGQHAWCTEGTMRHCTLGYGVRWERPDRTFTSWEDSPLWLAWWCKVYSDALGVEVLME